jgi:CheY-like chemotaxis protein
LSQTKPVQMLLLDDDPDEHFLFRADLEDAGVELDLVSFTHIDQAIAHLESRPAGPILVFSDLNLGAATAVDFTKLAFPLLQGGAIGVYSGTANPEAEAECRAAGASFYVVKPVTRDKLVTVIAALDGFQSVEVGDGGVRIALT